MRLRRMLRLAGVEVGAVVEVGDEADLGWAPAELLLGFRAGSRAIDGNEVRKPVEMSAASSGDLLTTGRFRRRPMAAAMSRKGMPWSPIA